jgi:hypothetical protein
VSLEDASFGPHEETYRTTPPPTGPNASEYFQSCAKQRMPFEFGQTCHYLWQLVLLAHRQEDRQHHEEVEDPQNTTAVKFRISMAANSAAMSRRYKENIAWLSSGER